MTQETRTPQGKKSLPQYLSKNGNYTNSTPDHNTLTLREELTNHQTWPSWPKPLPIHINNQTQLAGPTRAHLFPFSSLIFFTSDSAESFYTSFRYTFSHFIITYDTYLNLWQHRRDRTDQPIPGSSLGEFENEFERKNFDRTWRQRPDAQADHFLGRVTEISPTSSCNPLTRSTNSCQWCQSIPEY